MVTASLSSYTYLDGFAEDRDIPFGGNSVQHGSAVFDGIRCYQTVRGSALFRAREHIERLLHSAQTLGIEHEYLPRRCWRPWPTPPRPAGWPTATCAR